MFSIYRNLKGYVIGPLLLNDYVIYVYILGCQKKNGMKFICSTQVTAFPWDLANVSFGHTAVMPELSGGFAAEQPMINAQAPHTLDTTAAQCWVRNRTCSMTNKYYFKRNYLLQKVKNSTCFERCSNRYFKILSTILPISEVTNIKFMYQIEVF